MPLLASCFDSVPLICCFLLSTAFHLLTSPRSTAISAILTRLFSSQSTRTLTTLPAMCMSLALSPSSAYCYKMTSLYLVSLSNSFPLYPIQHPPAANVSFLKKTTYSMLMTSVSLTYCPLSKFCWFECLISLSALTSLRSSRL